MFYSTETDRETSLFPVGKIPEDPTGVFELLEKQKWLYSDHQIYCACSKDVFAMLGTCFRSLVMIPCGNSTHTAAIWFTCKNMKANMKGQIIQN